LKKPMVETKGPSNRQVRSDLDAEKAQGLGLKLLMQTGALIASGMPATCNRRWCFIAGFAYILHGVQKDTNDLDILTRDPQCNEQLLSVIHELGFQERQRGEDITQYINPRSETTADIMTNHVWEFAPKRLFWDALIFIDYAQTRLPTPSLADMVILKAVVYHRRDPSNLKRQLDLRDVRSLVNRKLLSRASILARARLHNLQDSVRDFLDTAGI